MKDIAYFNRLQKEISNPNYQSSILENTLQNKQMSSTFDLILRENNHMRLLYSKNLQAFELNPAQVNYLISTQDLVDSVSRISTGYCFTRFITLSQNMELLQCFTQKFQMTLHDTIDSQVFQKSYFQPDLFFGFNDVIRPQKYREFVDSVDLLQLVIPQDSSRYETLYVKDIRDNLSVEFQLFNSMILEVLINLEGAAQITKFQPSFPFQKTCNLIAPFCFLYDDVQEIIIIFSRFYIKLFHKLHDVQYLASLCEQSTSIIAQLSPKLIQHFEKIGFNLKRVLVPFFTSGFSQYLSCKQVFAVWDRVIQIGNLEVLAVVAAFIIVLKSDNCFGFSALDDMECYLKEVQKVEVVLLMQHVFSLIGETTQP